MKSSSSHPKLPEPEESKPLTVEVAMTELWQKQEASLNRGASILFDAITAALNEKRGLLIGRHGTIELTTVLQHFEPKQPLDRDRMAILERNAGIFAKDGDDAMLREWINEYFLATCEADILAMGWYKPLARAEWKLVVTANPTCKRIPLRALEPYYVEGRRHWTRALDKRRIVIVSSFTQSMRNQLDKRLDIWKEDYDTLLPSGKYGFVRSYYSPSLAKGKCEWSYEIESWRDAVDSLEERVCEMNPEVVLLGCGGLAMPLARRLKQKGIVAIVLGGAIQVLFGIKGHRWEQHPVISGFWNDAWIYPSKDEIPGAALEVEGGCYW